MGLRQQDNNNIGLKEITCEGAKWTYRVQDMSQVWISEEILF